MNIEKNHIFLFRIILCVTCWITIGIMVISSLFSANPLTSLAFTVSSYTFQSNFFVFIWITLAVIYNKKGDKPLFLSSIVHGAVTLYITVTLIIFALLLQMFYFPTEPLAIITNILAHYLVPILMIVEWYLTQEDEEYEKKNALYWLIYPFIYLAYSVILELTINVNLYYFISINEFGALMILFVVLLTVFFYGLSRILIYINQRHK